MTDLTAIQPGYEFPEQSLELDRVTVSAYVAAVEDPFSGFDGPTPLVPPLAVLALAMRGLTDLILRHPGTLHMSQQLNVRQIIPVGTKVTSKLLVKNRSERRGFAVLTLEARIDTRDALAMTGSMLLMVPLAAGGASNG